MKGENERSNQLFKHVEDQTIDLKIHCRQILLKVVVLETCKILAWNQNICLSIQETSFSFNGLYSKLLAWSQHISLFIQETSFSSTDYSFLS